MQRDRLPRQAQDKPLGTGTFLFLCARGQVFTTRGCVCKLPFRTTEDPTVPNADGGRTPANVSYLLRGIYIRNG